ncbi:MAG: helix-turn-helix transcriptional regulator [Dehalococcoidia bacterium]
MSSGSTRARVEDLTDTQRRVLDLIAQGKTNHEIGQALGITLDGAKYHVTEILNKLGVDSREEAAALVAPERGVRSFVQRVASRRVVAAAAAVGAIAVGLALVLAFLSDGEEAGPVPAIQAAFLAGEFDPEGVDRTKQIVVVDGDGNTRDLGKPAEYAAIEWSPDGRKLLALALDGETLVFHVFDVTNGDSHSWDSPELPQGWRWSPDSAALGLYLQPFDLQTQDKFGEVWIVEPDGAPIARADLLRTSDEATLRPPGLLWSEDSQWLAGIHGRDMVALSTSGDSRVVPLPDDFGAGHALPLDWTAHGLRIMNGTRLREGGAAWLLPALDGDWVPADPLDLEVDFAVVQSVEAEFAPAYSLAVSRLTADGGGRAYAFTEPRTAPDYGPPRVDFVVIRAPGIDARIEAPPDVYEFPDVRMSVVLAP